LRPRPDGPYGQSKLQAEKLITRTFKNSGKRYHLIRLGHVYGAEQWLSKYIIESVSDGLLELPYDGARSSNAIHVDDVAQALIEVILSPPASGIYNLASNPQHSWRAVFDWHSDVCGLKHVSAMDDNVVKSLHEAYIRDSRNSAFKKGLLAFGDFKQGFSMGWLLGSSEFKYVGNIALSLLPERVAKRMKAISAMRGVRNEIAALQRPAPSSPLFFCDAMPGPHLSVAQIDANGEEVARRNRDLASYYRTAIVGPG
jgi:hypothetical protein